MLLKNSLKHGVLTASFFDTIIVPVRSFIRKDRKTRRKKLVEIESSLLDIANLICIAHHPCINESVIYFSAVYHFYLYAVLSDFNCGDLIFYFQSGCPSA